MPSRAPPEKRASCQTTHKSPFGATAICGISALSRIGVPASGSRAPIESRSTFN
jgi:hypothetical protein